MLHPQLRIEQIAPDAGEALPRGAVITMAVLPYTIGRGFGNQLRLSHADISRRHLCVRLDDDYYAVEDMHSRNGSFVNGTRLAPGVPRRLQNGDVLQLAGVLSMVFVDPYVTQARTDVRPLYARGLWLDPQAHSVLVGGAPVDLPVQQYRLLALLYARAGAVVSRDEIAAALWSTGAELTAQMIDNTVSRLRANLQKHDGDHEYIVTVRGFGYQFVPRK